ncbi:hypothetical protein [Streptomyces sp. NBC_00557]|uniref:hypothetical protein n=1 Tax=Streptomyces sp. NBC_00557 TaxID=2975776 RepID=UPI002E7FB44C|nr:hypothetical protein [Streptomyces sp. NBC_00557]WUC32790.1 hypothetical protein OG956_00390 [Streptomyces sp. NBC_00557]
MANAKTTRAYPPGTRWAFAGRRLDHVHTEELALYPEPNYSLITDDCLPDEISTHELWRVWVDKVWNKAHGQ